jgi:hypothetical protein
VNSEKNIPAVKSPGFSTGMKRALSALAVLLLFAAPAAVQAQYGYQTNLDGSVYTYSTNTDGSISFDGYAGPPWDVTIPTNINGLLVTRIGDSAFINRISLTNLTIPGSVTSIGDGAFEFCLNLTSVTISNGVTDIGNDAFEFCSSLAGVMIPASVTNIGADVFSYCQSLTAITVDTNNSFYSSADGVLFDVSQGTLVEYPDGLAGSYTIPDGVTNIAEDAFEYCGGLTRVTIADDVTSIGDSAFEYCASLTNVMIPASVTNFGLDVFDYCPSLTAITVDTNNLFYSSVDGVLFDESHSTLVVYPGGLAGSNTIPGSVTSIGDGAFYSCTGLTGVTIPVGVTNIGNDAFYDCTSLASVEIPGSATSIGDHVFFNCAKLAGVTIDNGVTNIGSYMFDNCTSLTNVTIPGSVTSMGIYAFDNCTSLTNVTIPGSVTSMGDYVFFNCTSLTGVTIPGSVTSIGDGSFYFCASLASVTINNGVTNIGEAAFEYCTSLAGVAFPASVTSVGNDAFFNCTDLTNVMIPASVTTIGLNVFGYCPSLTAIKVDTNNLFYSSVNGVLFDEKQFTLVEYPGGLGGSYTIPGTVTTVGDYAFDGCGNLTNVTIPGSVASIGIGAFLNCASLINVTISGSVTNMGDGAFEECASLASVYFMGNAPSAVGVNEFYDDNNAAVYYLPGATGWSSNFWGFPAGPPAVLWNPLIQASGPRFGVQSNQFGFTITNTANANLTVMVDVCTNLVSPIWFPLQIVTLTNGLFYFSEPVQTYSSGYFYSLSWPFAQCGTLQVTIAPSDAASAGAAWLADGGPWQPGGAMVELPAGPHTVQFSNIAGWNTPSNLVVTITNGFLTTAMGNYTGQGGTLQVTITPPDAVSAGAEWQVDGGAWETNGATAALSAGAHTLQYSNIAGWNTPSNQIVTITNGYLTIAAGNYTGQSNYPYEYTASAGVITITGYSGSRGFVAIPPTINGLPVTGIGQYAFSSRSNLTWITIPATITAIGSHAFSDCASLAGVYFYGGAPSVDATVFSGDNNVTAYYLPGTTGWHDFSADTGLPTAPWVPQIQTSGAHFGVQSNQFGFDITWANGMVVEVEVCTNFDSPVWTTLQTVMLTNDLFFFSEPFQTNSSGRFYRLVSP